MLVSFRSDLRIARDAGSRFLPWLVAVMVFLAALGLTGALALQALIDGWQRDASGTLTVQVMPVSGDPAEAAAATDKRLARVVEALRAEPAVTEVNVLSAEDLARLVEPWLGSDAVIADLPLPRLIDVAVDPDATLDVAALRTRLAGIAPGTSVDEHRLWLARLATLAEGLRLLALMVMALVVVATTVTVIHATRTSLAVHKDQIAVLHLVGARDSYIASQYAGRWLWLGFLGGLIGLALVVPAVLALGWLAGRIEGAMVPAIELGFADLLPLLALPVGAGLLAMVTARITVTRALGQMP